MDIKRLSAIPHGVSGEVSMVVQRTREIEDSQQQKNPILLLNDMANLVGAVKAFLKAKHPTLSITDLEKMYEATQAPHLLMAKVDFKALERDFDIGPVSDMEVPEFIRTKPLKSDVISGTAG